MKGLKQDHRSIENELLDGGWPLLQPAVTMRREAVEDVGGYDERFEQNQDHDLFLKLAEVGRLSNLSSTVLKYRRHSEQATAQQSGRNFAAKYRKAKIRREAYLRRGRPLPDELRLTSLAGLLVRRGLSKTALWPYIQRTWGVLRRTN
jgi:GT2 family glycosyltransferase